MFLQSQVLIYTNNINEYVYLYTFLYPHFIEPLRHKSTEEQEVLLQKPLTTRVFKDLVKEVLSSGLFMHLKSKSDIDHQIDQADEKEFNDRVRTGQMS
jgi:hypothetical protein